jgi:hypothetical protein
MKTSPTTLQRFADRIIAAETAGVVQSDAQGQGAFLVCDKLRPHLSVLMGTGGFRALFGRALALAAAEIPWLKKLQLQADGSLTGLDDLAAQLDSRQVAEGGSVLLVSLLGLLAAFVGESVTLRVVSQAWPKVRVDDLGVGNRDKNEKEN